MRATINAANIAIPRRQILILIVARFSSRLSRHNALHAKSKVYIGRALSRKADGDLDEYQLWSSLALELLGKAALARKHPSLVVDPTHWHSLFVAAGINVTTDVKTIAAKTLFERLAHLVPRFDKAIQKFCQEIAERRNAELHSADLPFKTMKLDAWEARYWHACDTILHQMGSSLEQWLGAADAAAPRQLLDEAANALRAAVKLRVRAAREQFEVLKKAERERLAAEAELREPQLQTGLFKGNYDEVWTEACPACKCRSFMTGEQTGEDISEERDEDLGHDRRGATAIAAKKDNQCPPDVLLKCRNGPRDARRHRLLSHP